MMIKDHCQSYFIKEKKWPLCTLLPGASKALLHAVLRNKWISDNSVKLLGGITLSDWSNSVLEQNEKFIFPINLLPFIKDTALSFVRSEALHYYYSYMESTHHNKDDTSVDPDRERQLFKEQRECNRKDYPAVVDRRLILSFLFLNDLPKKLKDIYRIFQRIPLNAWNIL